MVFLLKFYNLFSKTNFFHVHIVPCKRKFMYLVFYFLRVLTCKKRLIQNILFSEFKKKNCF